MDIDYKTELEIMREKYKKHKVKPLKLPKPGWVINDPINRIYTDNAPDSIKRLVESITDEYERLFNVPIFMNKLDIFDTCPVNLYENDTAFYTIVMIFRDYLPGCILHSGILPIVAAPDKTDISIILPKKYWSRALLKLYRS